MIEMKSVFYRAGEPRPVASQDWHALVIDGGYRGIIFDCDGTLVHSGDAHFAALRDAVAEQGHVMARAWYESRSGLDRAGTLAAFADSVAGDLDIPAAAQASVRHFRTGETAITPVAQTKALVQGLTGQVAMAIGTNCETPLAQKSLHAAGLDGFFVHIVSVSEVLSQILSTIEGQ